MLAYKYNTEAEAKDAVNKCNKAFGYPKNECVTSNWCDYNKYDTFFYIPFDESLRKILGEPIEITINIVL